MQSPNDMELLRQYAQADSEEAFATLVDRHVNLIYSTALRQTNNPHNAEEIAQAVFIILAQKANRLPANTVLSGWLYQTARFAAANFLRADARRTHREQKAYMQSILTEASPDLWPQIKPLLEDAMGKLNQKERDVIALRFFEGKSFQAISGDLSISENAAKKRVGYALEKLRKCFGKRGIVCSAAVIAEAIAANSVHAAPVGLAKTISVVAIAKGATASTSTLTLIKGALKLMAWSKMKTAVVVGVGIFLAAGTIATTSKLFSESEIKFEAEGTVTYATAPDPRGSYTDTKHFIVMRDGNVWKIRTTTEKQERTGLGGPIGESVDVYYEMSFDGTNIYRLTQQDKNKILSTVPANERNKWVFAEGDVEKADSPHGNDIYKLYPVWLAYCSAPYFKNLSGNTAVSAAFPTRDFIGERIAKKQSPVKWNSHDKFFLKDASWFSDGNVEAHWPDGRVTTEKYQPPYDKPFVETYFENSSWTNWDGISMPTSFKMVAYQPNYTSTNTARFNVAYTITGSLEQIRNIEKFPAPPELTTETHITDWRNVQRDQPARYVSTNRWDFLDAIHQ